MKRNEQFRNLRRLIVFVFAFPYKLRLVAPHAACLRVQKEKPLVTLMVIRSWLFRPRLTLGRIPETLVDNGREW